MFDTVWTVWAYVSASQMGAMAERLIVTGKIEMSIPGEQNHLCIVIVVTRRQEESLLCMFLANKSERLLLAEMKI